MDRAQALVDIVSATSSEVLGQSVDIDGNDVDCVKRELTQEECRQFAFDGQAVEGVRLTVDSDLLGYRPVMGQGLEVDGNRYRVCMVAVSGRRLRVTLTRNIA